MAKREQTAVDAYIAKYPPEVRAVLRRVRAIIRRVLPDAEEAISYQIPSYKIHGAAVVYFAGWKQHWSLYPVTDAARAAIGAALDEYEVSKGTVRFPLSQPVPVSLVTRIVRQLARAAAERRGASPPRAGAGRRHRRVIAGS